MKRVLLPILFLIGCAPASEDKEADVDQQVQIVEVEEELTPIEKPLNIVTPEFWSSFDSDIQAVVFFASEDSLPMVEEELVFSIEENVTLPGVEYHQIYSSDSASVVFLNDTLMFDYTEYKNQYAKGYFLLKQGENPKAFGFKDDVDYIADQIKTYF